jgi:hypothetical protein
MTDLTAIATTILGIPAAAVTSGADATPIASAADATHLELRDDITLDQWATLGRRLLEGREASDWWVGDWLAEGWRRFATDDDGNEVSARAAELRSLVAGMTTLDLDVLRAARDTAERTPPRRRRRTLSFAHHQQVLDLDDQRADQLLDQAEHEGLESSDLKAAVRKANAIEGGEVDPPVKPAQARITIKAGVGDRDEAVVSAAAAAAESAALEVLAGAHLTGEVTVS